MKKPKKTILALSFITAICIVNMKAEELSKQVTILDEITVTATKTPIKVNEVPARVDIISSDELVLKANTKNIFEALNGITGVEVLRGNMLDTIKIRGQEPSILVNGRDMNFFSSLVSSSISSTSSIDKIEIIKGPQAGIHGSKAVSGIINIIKKRKS